TAVTTPGSYGFDVGPNILDLADNPMDQNNNGTNGEPGDVYGASFTVADVTGPRVTSAVANGTLSVSGVRLTFSEAIDPATFDTNDISNASAGLGGFGVSVVAGSGNTQFDVTFNAVSTAGTYSLNVGPDVRDFANNPMDQNNNGTNGEAGDFYTASFTVPDITGPRVIAAAPNGTNSVSSVRLTFSEAINPATFTAAD